MRFGGRISGSYLGLVWCYTTNLGTVLFMVQHFFGLAGAHSSTLYSTHSVNRINIIEQSSEGSLVCNYMDYLELEKQHCFQRYSPMHDNLFQSWSWLKSYEPNFDYSFVQWESNTGPCIFHQSSMPLAVENEHLCSWKCMMAICYFRFRRCIFVREQLVGELCIIEQLKRVMWSHSQYLFICIQCVYFKIIVDVVLQNLCYNISLQVGMLFFV